MVSRSAVGLATLFGVLATAPSATARQEEGAEGVEPVALVERLDAVRRVGRLVGSDVRGTGGEEGIARVRDLVLDDSGRVRFALLGLAAGEAEGGDLVPVPAAAMTITRIEDGDWFILLNVERARLEGAPAIGSGGVGALRDPARRAVIDAFFLPEEPDPAPGTGDDLAPDAAIVLATDLLDCEVFDAGRLGGEAVARVEELLIDDEHRSLYAVLRVDCEPSRQVPVPFSALRIGADRAGESIAARIGADRERLEAAPALEDDWPRMLNGSFIEAVNNVFGTSDASPTP